MKQCLGLDEEVGDKATSDSYAKSLPSETGRGEGGMRAAYSTGMIARCILCFMNSI